MNWRELRIADEGTHHRHGNEPAYGQRFDRVLAFHPPGLAPVEKDGKAWHIRADGYPAYGRRFRRTFGFYEGLAAVEGEGWHHIDPEGRDAYAERFDWCGNFQEGRAPVRLRDGMYRHILPTGQALTSQRWRYAGDFKDGRAVVQDGRGLSTHVDRDGTIVHNRWYLDLDVYHKGFARARDRGGWMHVDARGIPIYRHRFAAVEPFYNGQARVERFDGGLEVIDERGDTIVELRSGNVREFHQLSSDLVGYWKSRAIATAVRLGVFEHLPASPSTLSEHIGLPMDSCIRLLRALGELELVRCGASGQWRATSKGLFLHADHPRTLREAAIEYDGPLLECWGGLDDFLRDPRHPGPSIFRSIEQDPEWCRAHHRMLSSYAAEDYSPLLPLFPFGDARRIVDVGGGSGTLAALIKGRFPAFHVTLFDLPEVIGLAARAGVKVDRLLGGDMFEPWPFEADVVLLARVLHDWEDEDAERVLRRARASLAPGGRVFLVEIILDEHAVDGGLCDLHLLATTGGRERTLPAFERLLNRSGLALTKVIETPVIPRIVVGEVR